VFYEAGETNEEPLLQGLFYLTVIFYVFDRISNEFQLYLFLSRWENMQSVMCLRLTNLSPETYADGVYSGKSAYEAQLLGENHSPDLAKVWSIRAEPKVRF
jgi:hypothetical protein